MNNLSILKKVIIIVLSIAIIGCLGTKTNTHKKPTSIYLALLQAADKAKRSGDLVIAANLYANLHQKHPDNYEPLLLLANTTSELGNYEEAIQLYYQALALENDNLDIRKGLSKAYLHLYEFDNAAEQLTIILQQQPDDLQTLNILATLLDYLQLHTQAQGCYLTGLRINPNNAQLNNNYGLSLALAGNYQQALLYLQKASLHKDTVTQARANIDFVNSILRKIAAANADEQKLAEIKQSVQQTIFADNEFSSSFDTSQLITLLNYCQKNEVN